MSLSVYQCAVLLGRLNVYSIDISCSHNFCILNLVFLRRITIVGSLFSKCIALPIYSRHTSYFYRSSGVSQCISSRTLIVSKDPSYISEAVGEPTSFALSTTAVKSRRPFAGLKSQFQAPLIFPAMKCSQMWFKSICLLLRPNWRYKFQNMTTAIRKTYQQKLMVYGAKIAWPERWDLHFCWFTFKGYFKVQHLSVHGLESVVQGRNSVICISISGGEAQVYNIVEDTRLMFLSIQIFILYCIKFQPKQR